MTTQTKKFFFANNYAIRIGSFFMTLSSSAECKIALVCSSAYICSMFCSFIEPSVKTNWKDKKDRRRNAGVGIKPYGNRIRYVVHGVFVVCGYIDCMYLCTNKRARKGYTLQLQHHMCLWFRTKKFCKLYTKQRGQNRYTLR